MLIRLLVNFSPYSNLASSLIKESC